MLWGHKQNSRIGNWGMESKATMRRISHRKLFNSLDLPTGLPEGTPGKKRLKYSFFVCKNCIVKVCKNDKPLGPRTLAEMHDVRKTPICEFCGGQMVIKEFK